MQDCPRHRDAALWAYLSDPMPSDGGDRILKQKRIVEAIAAKSRRRIARFVVDSGGRRSDDGKSVRLERIIAEARATGRSATVLVASFGCLATTRLARRDTLTDMLTAGLIVEDPSGSLHPTRTTLALAKTAAARRSIRYAGPPTRTGRND